jgi:hypothetical protein
MWRYTGCGGTLILVGLFSDDDADENQRKQIYCRYMNNCPDLFYFESMILYIYPGAFYNFTVFGSTYDIISQALKISSSTRSESLNRFIFYMPSGFSLSWLGCLLGVVLWWLNVLER